MSKLDRAMTDRATPELLEWVETVDRNATQKTVLARARAAHEAVWQAPRNAAAFSFRRGHRRSATGGLLLLLLFCAGPWSELWRRTMRRRGVCGGCRC